MGYERLFLRNGRTEVSGVGQRYQLILRNLQLEDEAVYVCELPGNPAQEQENHLTVNSKSAGFKKVVVQCVRSLFQTL